MACKHMRRTAIRLSLTLSLSSSSRDENEKEEEEKMGGRDKAIGVTVRVVFLVAMYLMEFVLSTFGGKDRKGRVRVICIIT